MWLISISKYYCIGRKQRPRQIDSDFEHLWVVLLVVFFVADMKLNFSKRGWGPNQQPVISKLLTLTDLNFMHCFIDTFSDP